MTTPAKLYGRELSAYDEVDVDELLAKLSQEELTMLAKEVDPDVSKIITTLSLLILFIFTLEKRFMHLLFSLPRIFTLLYDQ